MKILHLNYSDQIGGAATSVMRLHQSLLKNNINSNMFVKEHTTNEKNIFSKNTTLSHISDLLKKAFLRKIAKISKLKYKSTLSLNYLKGIEVKEIDFFNPNIVNLHWISNEMISLKEISKIKQPIVWTLVDMWLFCGAEHYSTNKRFLNGYNRNNRDKNKKGIDIDKFVWSLKKKYLDKKKIKIVCISSWLAKQARKSKLLQNFDIRVINCAIDHEKWKPIEKIKAKKILGLNPKKKLILFGATGGTRDPRKGFNYLKKALDQNILKKQQFDLMIFGEQNKTNLKINNKKIYFQNQKFYGNDIALRTIYSAADLLVAPSIQEAFGQVASEAGCCKTPSVAFRNTGFEDVINHKKSGYLADLKNYKDLAKGINWCLKNSNRLRLGFNARKHIASKLSYKKISSKYIELYKELI